jgi:choline dehydrogenase
MRPYVEEEYRPGPEIETDEQILEFIRASATTIFHPVGTCKMGGDADAVVDERLCVRGARHLRVVDASIMPTLTSGNTNAPAIMIGEKAADMIIADAWADELAGLAVAAPQAQPEVRAGQEVMACRGQQAL